MPRRAHMPRREAMMMRYFCHIGRQQAKAAGFAFGAGARRFCRCRQKNAGADGSNAADGGMTFPVEMGKRCWLFGSKSPILARA